MKKSHISKRGLFGITLLILLAIAISIVGFQQLTKDAIKKDWLENQSCSLPCWNQIIPGVTTRNEAIKILENIPHIDGKSIKLSGTDALGGCKWKWKLSTKRLSPGLDWKDGVVQGITLGLPFDLSLEEVLNQFGSPEAFIVSQGGQPEIWYWIVDMDYPQFGIQVIAYTSDFSTLIEPQTEIGAIKIFSPTSIENRIAELKLNMSFTNNNQLYTSWKGYGDLMELYNLKAMY